MRVLSQITGRPLDAITLRDLSVQCVIGVHPEEKIRPQTLRLDVRLFLDTSAAARSGSLSRTVDYSLVAKQLVFILTHSRFRLLESAAEALAEFLLSAPNGDSPTIHAVDIEIKKPEALGGLSEPSVRIFRDLQNRQPLQGVSPSDRILFQVPEAVLERWIVPAEASLMLEGGEGISYLAESSGLLCNGKIFPAGTPLPSEDQLVLHNNQFESKSVIAVTFRGRERFQQQTNRLH